MQKEEAIELIGKYLTNSINLFELERLSEWLDDGRNKIIFEEQVRLNYAVDFNLTTYNLTGMKKVLEAKIEKEHTERIKRKRKLWYAAVASLAAVLTIAFFALKANMSEHGLEFGKEKRQVVSISPGENKAVLVLENGENVILEPGKVYKTEKVASNGQSLVYNDKFHAKEKEIRYNELTVPRGGQFQLELTDGTKVWLNSESKLKYPVSFENAGERKVLLLYGEAYFEVSPSSFNNDKPFLVTTEDQEVKVLGTEFNIRANLDDENVYTTLVEGRVNINNGTVNKNITPGEQSVFNISDGTLNVARVDVNNTISWKHGYFNFDKMTLEEMMKILSRWYNFEYLFEQKELKTKIFSGFLKREDDISKLLTYLERTEEVKFKQDNDVLIITK